MAEPQPTTLGQWLTAGVRAHEAGDHARARSCYQAALQLSPEQPDALHLLGVLADQEGRHAEAVDLIRRAIARMPQVASFHGNLGTALLAMGDDDGAEAAYGKAVALDPAYVDGHVNLGNLCRRRGDEAAAAVHYRAALALEPEHAAARRSLITALLILHQTEEALQHLGHAIRREPQAADLRDMVGKAMSAERQYKSALLHQRKAVALAPDDLDFRENYATTLSKILTPDALTEAAKELEAVLERDPQRVGSLVRLGALQIKRQRLADALRLLDRAAAIEPDRLDLLVNRAFACMLSGRIDEARRCIERAMIISPDDCLVLTCRGALHEYLGDYQAALADYRAALQARQHRSEAAIIDVELKLSLLLLSLGRLAEGWPLYQARNDAGTADPRSKLFPERLPEWDGVARPGLRILVWGEQGLGDQVVYAQMLPELVARGTVPICLCDPRLVPLLRRSFPGLQIEGIAQAETFASPAVADVQIGLGALGSVLRPTLADFPPPQAYLKPDAKLVETFRQRYRQHGRKYVIGLSWRSKNAVFGDFKSVQLLDWAPVLQQPDILFVDLQYGDTAAERTEVARRLGVEILHDDSVDAIADIDRYAAQAAAMDLVIGTSNSGLHIAAATGRPCWGLLPGGAGRLWYWFLDRENSPWYRDMRLFRQPHGTTSEWASTIARVAAALQAWRAERA